MVGSIEHFEKTGDSSVNKFNVHFLKKVGYFLCGLTIILYLYSRKNKISWSSKRFKC